MKRIVIITLFLTLVSFTLRGQVTLKIVIKNLVCNAGNVIMDFRDGNDKELMNFTENIIDKQCVITVNGLQPGKYSFKYFHDENSNNQLDTYLIGAPKEGYGFSNNAKGKFGPPDYTDTVFELTKDTTIVCTPNYIKF